MFAKYNPAFRYQIISIILLLIIGLLLYIGSFFPQFIECFYSEGVYVLVSKVRNAITGALSFSIGDILYILLAVLFAYQAATVVVLLFKKQVQMWLGKLLSIIIGLQVLVIAFYLLWGMNYFRPPASQLLNLTDTAYTTTELKKITSLLIDSVNTQRSKINIIGNEPDTALYNTSANAIKTLSLNSGASVLQTHSPAAKSSLLSSVINYLNTEGYFNPFTGEAQVNYQMPVFNQPLTACHEMAHQLGFGREDEANFIGYLAALHSTDGLLQYSAYYMAMREFMHQLHRQDSLAYKQLKIRISANVRADIKTDSLYWKTYDNRISYISSVFYDSFLKANNQPQGLRTYNRMVILTMAYYRRKGVLNQSANLQ